MPDTQPWLPESALCGELAARDVLSLIDGWSTDWLARTMLIAPRNWRAEEALPLDLAGLTEHHASPMFRLLLAPDALTRIASAVFDRELSQRDMRKPRDRLVISQVAVTAIDDLVGRLEALFGKPGGTSEAYWAGRKFGLPLHLGDLATQIVIEVPGHVLVGLVRKASRHPRQQSVPLPGAQAVEGLKVAISVCLGSNRLALGELAAIDVGDVLRLETDAEAALDINVEGKPCGRNAASVGMTEAGFALQIERSANQW